MCFSTLKISRVSFVLKMLPVIKKKKEVYLKSAKFQPTAMYFEGL